MGKVDEEAARIPSDFWHMLSEQAWDEAENLVSEDFEGFLPQTQEKVSGSGNLIELLQRILGTAKIKIHNQMTTYDVWDKEHEVALQIQVELLGSKVEALSRRQFVLAFFTVDRDYLISRAILYFANCGSALESHQGLTENY